MNHEEIAGRCLELGSMKTRGELGQAIAGIVLSYSTRDLQQMRWNFSGKIRDIERWIAGPFDAETLVSIADSMGSPSEIDQNQEIYTGYTSLTPGTFPPGITVPGTPIRES